MIKNLSYLIDVLGEMLSDSVWRKWLKLSRFPNLPWHPAHGSAGQTDTGVPVWDDKHCAEFEDTDYAPCSSFITSAMCLCSLSSWKCLPWLWSGEALKFLLLLAEYSMKGDAWQGNAFRWETSD